MNTALVNEYRYENTPKTYSVNLNLSTDLNQDGSFIMPISDSVPKYLSNVTLVSWKIPNYFPMRYAAVYRPIPGLTLVPIKQLF